MSLQKMENSNVTSKTASRRRFLLAAGATGAAAVAAPSVVKAQGPISMRWQSTWPSKDIFHEFALDYAKKVADMSGGRLKFDVLPAGTVAPAFQLADAVHAGILDAGHSVCAYGYGKHKAYSLFGTPPSFGWDAQSFLGWFYHGGGEALYKELVNDILKLNLIGILYFPMPTQPLGWFKKEVKSAEDFKNLRYRTVGLSSDLFKALGASVMILPGGEIMRAMNEDLLDGAEFNNPSSDLQLGLPEVAKVYMMGSHHQQVEAFEVLFNKQKHDSLPAELKAILRWAAFASGSDMQGVALDRYSKDFQAIKKRGVSIVKTGEKVLDEQLAAWDKVIAEHSADPFFKKVIESQKAWVKRTAAYVQTNNLDSNALSAAYRHFLG